MGLRFCKIFALAMLAFGCSRARVERCDESVRLCYEMAFDLVRKSGCVFNPRLRGLNTPLTSSADLSYAI